MFRKFVFVLLIAVSTLAVGTASAQLEESVRGGNRDRAPVIDVRDFNLEKYEGKVVMIAFWRARECAECEPFIPWLADMQGWYGEDGLVVVAVNQDIDSAAAADWISKIHSRSQVVLDKTGKMAASYQIEGMPSTYLYDRNLNLTDKFVGFVPEETKPVEEAIEKLLKKKYED